MDRVSLIELRAISKRYGAVQANDKVDLTLYGGEVHALLGENGAGKSTLSKILYGFVRADSGQILLNGSAVELHSPREARAHRIGMVFQNFMLIPALSVLENIALYLADLPAVLSRKRIGQRIAEFGERFSLRVDPDAMIRQLSVGEQQKVEILKLLMAEARVLILDEPTKVLAPHEVEALFRVFDALKAQGYAILFITHKLREVLRCADRITVMRQGRVAGRLESKQADEEALVTMMFGEHATPAHVQSAAQVQSAAHIHRPAVAASNTDQAEGRPIPDRAEDRPIPDRAEGRPTPDHAEGRPLLELRTASCRAAGSETALRDLNLRIDPGEIVGVAGVSGSGQKELGDLILGFRPLSSGSKWFHGVEASPWSIARMRESGLAFVPEDPLVMAAVPGMSVRENLALGTGSRYWKGVGLDWPRLESAMRDSFGSMRCPVPPLDPPIATLSGGNLQRVVIARELAHAPSLILALYPTRGLDVRSAASVRELLREARDRGSGVLLISEDLDELADMADRLLVLFAGTIVGAFKRGAWQAEEVGHLMTGTRGRSHPATAAREGAGV